MDNVTYRTAVSDDLPGIIGMLADDALGSRREDVSLPPNARYTASFDAINQDPNQLLVVTEVGQILAGCLQLTLIPGLSRLGMWRGQIESVRIAARFRGQGLGSEMVEWAIAECHRRGCGLVQLTTDKDRKDALRFYTALGFTASHEGLKLIL
ncbi:MAG: GNAT family N-acetyltransferase [Woeseiaceae bacterium]